MEEDASFKGNIAAIDFIVGKNFKHYIPGHGQVGSVAMPQTYRTYLAILRSKVGELYEEGLADFEMKPDVVIAVSAPVSVGPTRRSRPGSSISRASRAPHSTPRYSADAWRNYFVDKYDLDSKLKIGCYTFLSGE